ncbi:MAG: type II toxin-antitoxin system Phd/YefM family antitoxin [Spirochaetes bacterium]|nr:type II toxin-antitoxin system Phd/YefM family antitoxin [Spirochaetota bacterium]
MTHKSIIKGLDEAIKINKDELKGRRVIGMLKDDPNLIETLYLSSIPENKDSIIEGLDTALEDCVSEDEVVW